MRDNTEHWFELGKKYKLNIKWTKGTNSGYHVLVCKYTKFNKIILKKDNN